MQLKLKKRFGESEHSKNLGWFLISLKHLFFGEGFKNDSTTDREIENELNLISLDI